VPGFIYAIAARLAATDEPAARVRLQTADGFWAVVHVAAISHGPCVAVGGGYAITLDQARPDTLASLLLRAWSLTPREREVAELVLDGLSSEDIAATLVISAHTARDHLKAIFDKLGIHRRRDLSGTLARRSVTS
jgi:DNA-binding CsgD family transcriptional regulator